MSSPERTSPQLQADHAIPGHRSAEPQGPTLIGLARIAPRWYLSASTRDLYRKLARLVELGPETEFILAPCGGGMAVLYLADSTGAAGAGVDPAPHLIEMGNARARDLRLIDKAQFERAELDDLPYQDEVFDLAIGEVGLGVHVDLETGVRELVRVTRPMGTVVLIQFTWTGEPDPERRAAVAEKLGVWPHLLVECKRMLREAGVVDLHADDWGESGRSQEFTGTLPQLRSFRDRAELLWRAWRTWRWPGVEAALNYRSLLYELMVRERVLSLSVIRGTRWSGGDEG